MQKRHIGNNSTFMSPSSRETNGKINDINSEGEISLGAVKKYLQAWVTYLQDTNHPEKDLLHRFHCREASSGIRERKYQQ